MRTRRMEVLSDSDVAEARRAVRIAMQGRPDDCVHAAELVAGELVTNALLHGGGVARLAVVPTEGGVRIEVEDANRHAPLVALLSSDAMTGRGLHLVARLAARTGVLQTDTGKLVWTEIAGMPHIEDPRSAEEILADWDDAITDEVATPTVAIELGDVPTALLIEAKRHVDNLVRELTLVEGGERTGTTPRIPAPLAELIERVVYAFGDARREIKRQATEAARVGAPRTSLALELPVDAIGAARQYLDALDEADAYARANRLLTLETPPQHRAFRRWYISQLVVQLEAVRDGVTRPPVVAFEQWLLEEFDAAEGARRAADIAARIYRVAVALATAATPEDVSTAVLREAVDALGATGGGVLLTTDASVLAVPGTIGYDETTVELLRRESRDAELPAAYALRTGEAVWLETIEERDARFPALTGLEPNTVSMCAVPLRAGDGVIGALRFSFSANRLFDDDEQQFVLVLAAETAEAMQRARLLASDREIRARLEHERQSLEKVAAVGEAMLRRRDLDAILELATDAATQITGAAFGVFAYNAIDERGEGHLLYTLSGVSRDVLAALPMPGNPEICGSTFTATETVRLDDVTADTRFGVYAPDVGLPFGHLPVRSYLVVPVTLSDGETVGGLFFGHPEPGRFGDEAERFATGIAGQTSAAIENVRSLEERAKVAAALQQSLLPADLPQIDGVDLGAAYSAAGHGVGGDFYDVFPLGGSRWGIVVGDVRGRGPEAAAVTALARYTIRTASMLERGPAQVMSVLDNAMRERDDERFCTAVFGVLDLGETGATFTYVNAGHPPFAIVRGGSPRFLEPTGPLVGAIPDPQWAERTVDVAPGDALVLYTDGISEARHNGEEFGDALLATTLHELGGSDPGSVAEGLAERARCFAGDAPTDDAAVFVIRLR